MTFQVTDILALIQGPDNVGDNWRVIRPYTRLRQAGVNARWAWGDDHQYLPTDPDQTILVVRLMTGSDEATIDRWLEERRPSVRAIVYELDDVAWGPAVADHLEAADFMQGKTRDQILRDGEMARYFASQCDGVIVSTEALAAQVRASVDRPVVVVPNAIDVRWFRAQMAARPGWQQDGRVTIGWCGGRRPEADVAPMAEAWGRIAARYPQVRFVVASSLIPDVIYREVPDDRIIRFGWVSWEDSPVLYQTDIGCCAVADTPFNRAKSPIKAWEYVLAGAAVVGTDLMYGDCLDDGFRGMTAETADDWERCLSEFVESGESRRQLSRNLRQHVERHHSLDGNLHRWTDALAQIVDSTAGAAA